MIFIAFVKKCILVILCNILFFKCIDSCFHFNLSDNVAANSFPSTLPLGLCPMMPCVVSPSLRPFLNSEENKSILGLAYKLYDWN